MVRAGKTVGASATRQVVSVETYNSGMNDDTIHLLAQRIQAGDPLDRDEITAISGWQAEARRRFIDILLLWPAGRRWLRARLLSVLPAPERAALAERLLDWPEDFDPLHRDVSIRDLVWALPEETFDRALVWLAGTNAAGAVWERVARTSRAALRDAALHVLRHGTALARETMIYLLLLDPEHPDPLSTEDRTMLLAEMLVDPDPEVRGHAAELAAESDPELLLAELDTFLYDESERVRAAAWATAFAADHGAAAERAATLVADEGAPLPVRRSALCALGERLSTEQIAPLLALLVTNPERTLAEDAAELLWRRHRHPLPAQAAVQSPHPGVREIGERLLHPARGSPAAGGDRPGAPTSAFYRHLLGVGQKPNGSKDQQRDRPHEDDRNRNEYNSGGLDAQPLV